MKIKKHGAIALSGSSVTFTGFELEDADGDRLDICRLVVQEFCNEALRCIEIAMSRESMSHGSFPMFGINKIH